MSFKSMIGSSFKPTLQSKTDSNQDFIKIFSKLTNKNTTKDIVISSTVITPQNDRSSANQVDFKANAIGKPSNILSRPTKSIPRTLLF
eukprot:2139196-Ditylum_brightwellii.AAC.1